jgi:hypothetical protein
VVRYAYRVRRLALTLALLAASLAHAGDPCVAPEVEARTTLAAKVAEGNSDTSTPGRPAVAAGDDGWLAVSRTSSRLAGVVVSRAGEVGATVGFAPCPSGPSAPDAAFASPDFLVVAGCEGAIRGFRVTPLGTALDPAEGIDIADGPSDFGSAVAAGAGGYLVVWQRYDSTSFQDIYGAVVTPDGQVSARFPIFVAPGEQAFPAVACGGASCLVVWRDTRSGSGPAPSSDIYGARVMLDGTVLDPAGIPITTAPGAQGEPAVAFDGTRYLVVWSEAKTDALPYVSRIAGVRVEGDGSVAGGPIDIATAPTPKVAARAAFDGAWFWVTWWVDGYRRFSPVGIGVARVSRGGTLVDAPPDGDGVRVVQPQCDTCRVVGPNLAFGGDTALLAWTNNDETMGTSKDVEGRLIRARAGADPCWSLAGATIVHATASGNGITCTLACRQPYSRALIFEEGRRYRVPAPIDGLACPFGGTANVPDEVGRAVGRRRRELRPDNLGALKRAIAPCFGKHAHVVGYHTMVRSHVDGLRLSGRATVTGTQGPGVGQAAVRFSGVLHGSELPLVPPSLPRRQARLPECREDLPPHCTP